MSVSTLAPTPETDHTASGAGASTDTTTADIQPARAWRSDRLPHRPIDATDTAIVRGARDDYWAWLDHVTPAGGCTRPIRLRGEYDIVDTTTGELTTRSTADLPDKVIYTACGNRRASVCPSCAETYRADTYQLVLAGLNGGKGIPTTVVQHPCAFPTFTAPSFGLVHSTRRSYNGRNRVCRPGRTPRPCPHEVDLRCRHTHHTGQKILGKPLCVDCYDHHHQVVWNVMAGELWRRTTDKAKTLLATWADEHDVSLRLSFAKVAEMQARGVAHFHALIRIDGINPDNPADVIPPDPGGLVGFDLLAQIITEAARSTRFRTPPHPDQPDGWLIEWGPQLLVLPVREQLDGQITDTKVAGYLAKYATKATEATGHTSTRITEQTVDDHIADLGHVARLIAACWDLGRPGSDLDPTQATRNSGRLSYRRLRRWAHMLGFGGHFSTKSRHYSTTLKALRHARTTWRRQHHRTAEHTDDDTTLLIGGLAYDTTGWRTTGDALLANTAAAKAREHRRIAREELQAHDLRLTTT